MDEITYLNYGNDQIDQNALFTSMADNVQSYVNSQSWSRNRKQKFLNAYQDIVSKGIIGANNTSGQWAIDLNSDIDLSSMPQKDQEMYHEAAYYILQQMKGIPTKAKEEETKKEDLPTYDNKTHQSNINALIGNKLFGGRNWSTSDDWNVLDERDETTGLRGTNVRANKLADMLDQYSQSLEDGKYNFEGTAFTDLNDLKTRIGNAVTQLRNGTWDQNDVDALNQIGLDWRTYFNDGSGDIAGTDANGNEITYGQLAKQNQAAAAAAAKEEAAKKAVAAKQNAGVLDITSGINPQEARTRAKEYAEWLGNANTYGVGQQGFNKINARVQELIEGAYAKQLSGADKKELGNLLYYITTNNPNYQNYNLTPEEEVELQVHENMKGRRLQDFRRLPWNTSDGRNTYIDKSGNLYFLKPRNQKQLQQKQFTRSAAYNNYKNNFLKGTSAMNAQERENYLKSSKDGLTSAEWEELASIGFDIASIVDPEMISSAGLALAGSGLRHHATASQPGGMSTSDKWWQAADYGLSLLGSIPVLGDSALAWRALNNLKKAIKPLGFIMAGANVPQAAKAAYNKVVNGQDLTVQDWRAIGAVVTAAVGVGRGRQMAKRAEALRRTGGNTSKTSKEGVIKTSEGEIKVDENTAKQLKQQFKGADGATRTQKLRENTKVQEAARQQGIDLSKAEVQGNGRFKRSPISSTTSTSTTSGNRVATLRAMSEFNKNHGWLARKGLAEQDWVFRHTGGYESTPTSNWFKDAWNNLRKSKWDEFGNKNNPTTSATTATTTTNTSSQQQNQGINIPAGRFDDRGIAREEQLNRAIINRYKNILSGNVSNNPVKEGKFKFNDINVEVKKAPTGTYDIFINGKRTDSIKDLTSTELKKHIASLVKEHRSSVNRGKSKSEKVSVKEMGKILQDLKKMGWLKRGGQINNFNLDKTISEFLSKQK